MLALKLHQPNSILITTSCSQHLTKQMFLEVLQKAGSNITKELVILEQLHQAIDHPIPPSIPKQSI